MASGDPKSVVNLYKNLFIILSVITLLGVAVVYLHLPMSLAIVLSIIFMLIKTGIVYRLFAKFLTAKLGLRILIGLSLFLFLFVIILPVVTHHNHLQGSVDVSKELGMEQLTSTPSKDNHGH